MTTQSILDAAEQHLEALQGHVFDILDLAKPMSFDSSPDLARVISKLSPLLGNLIEFNLVDLLNKQSEFRGLGEWMRQDPGFPDAVFRGKVSPEPGLEIKTWFPLATEITARFKESQTLLADESTRVVLLAWLPENLVYGRPSILGVSVVPALSVAHARDEHYHNPPDYLVVEPEDTTSRTRNLQQTNVNGFKWQGTPKKFISAERIVDEWGTRGREYRTDSDYQSQLRDLMGTYRYRGDTNFAKMDRICHDELEVFKSSILGQHFKGLTIREWSRMLSRRQDEALRDAFEAHVDSTPATEGEVVGPHE